MPFDCLTRERPFLSLSSYGQSQTPSSERRIHPMQTGSYPRRRSRHCRASVTQRFREGDGSNEGWPLERTRTFRKKQNKTKKRSTSQLVPSLDGQGPRTSAVTSTHVNHGTLKLEELGEEERAREDQRSTEGVQAPPRGGVAVGHANHPPSRHQHDRQGVQHVPSVLDVAPEVTPYFVDLCYQRSLRNREVTGDTGFIATTVDGVLE